MVLFFVPPDYNFQETPLGHAVYWVIDKAGNKVGEVAAEEAQEAVEEGLGFIATSLIDVMNWLGDAFTNVDWDAVGEAVGKVASEVIKASTEVTSGIAKEIVPDLIESVERGYEVIREKMDGKEASMIGAFTVGFLVIMTFVYIFYEVRRGK